VVRIDQRDFGYIASQKPLDQRGIAGPIPLLWASPQEGRTMKKVMMVAAVAMSMFAIAPAHAQSVADCAKGPSENYVKCLEAVIAALRSDLEKFKSDVGNKAFQGELDQTRNEVALLKGKVNELEGRVGDMERVTKGLTGPLRIMVGDNCLRVTGDPSVVALASGCGAQASAFILQSGQSPKPR